MAKHQYEVLILGFGEIARAIEHLLAPRHTVRIWTRRPQTGRSSVDLETAVPAASFIFFCLPTAPHYELALQLRRHLAPDAVCISVSKGLDDNGRNAAEALAAALPEHRFGVLCGPMIAEEIVRGRPGFAQFAGTDARAVERVRDLFERSALVVEAAVDPIATSWAAVLKNVYAIAIGLADGLDLGDNVRGFLVVAAQREAATLVARLTGRQPACYELASLGDLVTTATSAGSHHHAVGLRLAQGETGPLTGEGVHTAETITRLNTVSLAEYPLFNFIVAALHERGDLRSAFLRLLADVRR